MHVLVTRPEPQATATAALLRARGHTAHLGPVARIEAVPAPLPPAEAIDAVILTSANAVPSLRAFVELPVYVVGEATARAARAAGARLVLAAQGDWQSLVRLLGGGDGPPAGARLLHLAGAEVRGDLEGATTALGFAYERRVVYAARSVTWLAAETIGLLEGEALDAALFFSPAHATIWRLQVERAALVHRLFPLAAIALSAAVAAPLRPLPWRRLGVAAAPEVAALLDRLEAQG